MDIRYLHPKNLGNIVSSPRAGWRRSWRFCPLSGFSSPACNCSARQGLDTDQHGFDGYTQIHPEKSVRIRPIRGNPRPISSPLGSSVSSYSGVSVAGRHRGQCRAVCAPSAAGAARRALRQGGPAARLIADCRLQIADPKSAFRNELSSVYSVSLGLNDLYSQV